MSKYLDVLFFLLLLWLSVRAAVRFWKFRIRYNVGLLTILLVALAVAAINLFFPETLVNALSSMLGLVPGGRNVRIAVQFSVPAVLVLLMGIYIFSPQIKEFIARRKAKGR